MSNLSRILLLTALLWQSSAAENGAFTFPTPTDNVDYSRLPILCIDQHINIQWHADTTQNLSMTLWQTGTNKTDSNFGSFPNTGDYGWYVDTGLDYTAAPFYFSMYISGSGSPDFSSGLFNISVCDNVGSGSGTGPVSSSGGGTTSGSSSGVFSSASSSTPTSSLMTDNAAAASSTSAVSSSSNSQPASASGPQSSSAGSTTSTTTQSSRATVVSPSSTAGNSNNGLSAEAPLQAIAAGVLGSWLLAAL